ncbi:DUF6559 family protein [Vibrio sp. VPAP30]|uniref:DUF6559 family protein n=1 Tax=Vibrio sp. VPAP30 TaxID=1647102 RepID=UPI000659047E|nr:DUF6559 family protein [Vibrio sp. VPAP30]KLN63451.1 hypothetical protein ZX61_18130 [Vibrio sp. VPAP30]
MPVFRTFFKRRALRKMMTLMVPALVKGYGSREFYTVGQVHQAAMLVGTSKRYFHYNLALFCNKIDLEQSGKFELSQNKLNGLRNELSDKIFSGEDYTALDVIKLNAPIKWKGGSIQDHLSNHHGMNSRF